MLGFIFFASFFLVGCDSKGEAEGSSTDNNNESTKLGIIVDSHIVGLRYISTNKIKNKTIQDITNSKGEFEYFEDGVTEFFIGNIKLVSIKPSKMTAITTVANTKRQAQNIARFLQTIDKDGKPSNGIQIPRIVDRNAVSNNLLLNFDDSFDANFDNIKYLLYSHTIDAPSTVSAKQALEHSSKSARLSSLNEFSLYKAIANEKNYNIEGGLYNTEIFKNNQKKRVYLWIWEHLLLNEMAIEDELQFSIPTFNKNNIAQTREKIKKYLDYTDAIQGIISLEKNTYKNLEKAQTQSFSYNMTQLTSLSINDCSTAVKLYDAQEFNDNSVCKSLIKIFNPTGHSSDKLLKSNPILSSFLLKVLPQLLNAKNMNWKSLDSKPLKTISKLKVSSSDINSIASAITNASNEIYGTLSSSDINKDIVTRILARKWLSIKFRSGFKQDYMNILINNNSIKLKVKKEQIEALALKMKLQGRLCGAYKSFIPSYECTGAENISYDYNKVVNIINKKLLKSNALYKNIIDSIGSVSDEKGNIGTAMFDLINEGDAQEENNLETVIVKKTGQTKSYNTDGDEVQDNSLEDDGYHQKGIEPTYNKHSDVVLDNITKLMWQDNEEASVVKKQWLTDENYKSCKDYRGLACSDTSGNTAASYCSNLNLNGYTDWRLPSSTELESIVDYSNFKPALDTDFFEHVSSSRYWSSTDYSSNNSYAWSTSFINGYVFMFNKKNNFHVRCVRDGE
jgi:hypothetical protein